MVPPPEDHDCSWPDYAKHLETKVETLEAKLARLEKVEQQYAELKRQQLGPKSEKLPPIEREVKRDKPAERAEVRRKRKENELAKTRMATETIPVPVPAEKRACPQCGDANLKPVGAGKVSTVYDYVPGYFRKRVYQRETLRCSCGDHLVTAPAPERTTDKTQYSPSFVAHIIVSKCGDSIPLYRMEKHFRRVGVPISRSTMTDLFHRHAELLEPLSSRLLQCVAESEIVLADETSIKMLGTTKRAFVWAFLADQLIAYRFSPDRSGRTPREVLGGTTGALLVDAYTGYNRVTGVDGRERAGCLAHARRKLFAARESEPSVDDALELIRQIYIVEHEAKEEDVVGTVVHLAMRRARSRPLMAKLFCWLRSQRGLHPPKGPVATAVRYALNNRRPLTRFLNDPRLPPDNNRSESALRVVALGRKNFLFVGNEDAGQNVAGLYSLVATCAANGINPLEYLADVMMRVSDHPAARIDELLPHRWEPRAQPTS